jgi:hypothetical protein
MSKQDDETTKLRKLQQGLRDGTIKIKAASQDDIKALRPHVQTVLQALAAMLGDKGILGAWVSDESLPSDFGSVDYEALSQALGIPVERGEYLWQIAWKLKQKISA